MLAAELDNVNSYQEHIKENKIQSIIIDMVLLHILNSYKWVASICNRYFKVFLTKVRYFGQAFSSISNKGHIFGNRHFLVFLFDGRYF